MRANPELSRLTGVRRESPPLSDLSFVRLAIPPQRTEDCDWQKKIVGIRELHDYMDWTTYGLPWALLIGCFDDEDIHPGHLALLTTLSRDYGMPLAVAIENSRTIQNNKGGLFRPYATDDVRLEKLAKLNGVTGIALFDDTVKYGAPDIQSQRTTVRRMEQVCPPFVLIDMHDPYTLFPHSQYTLATRMHSGAILFEKVSTNSTPYSTTRRRGY